MDWQGTQAGKCIQYKQWMSDFAYLVSACEGAT